MKTVVLSCDACGLDLKNISAAHTLFSGDHRRDFCTDACFNDWARRHCGPTQTTFGVPNSGLRLEQATDWDIWTVYGWNNDPEVRSQSFSTASIPREDHQKWFATHRENITMAWLPVGCARVDEGEISVVVDPDQRGRGVGKKLIAAVSQHNTVARVKEDNEASLKAFSGAGYTEVSREDGVVTMVRK